MSQFPPQPYPPQPYPPQGYPPQQPAAPAAPPQGYAPQQPAPAAPQGYAPQQAPQGYSPALPQGAGQPFGSPQGGNPLETMFEGVAGTKVQGEVSYLKPGHYVLRVDDCKTGTKQGTNDPFIAVEMTVVLVLDYDNSEEGHPVGDTASFYAENSGPGKQYGYFQKDVNAFVSTMLGVEAEMTTREQIISAFGPGQPFRGHCVEMRIKRTTKQDGTLSKVPKSYFKRRVPSSELLSVLSRTDQEKFWPGGQLAVMAQQIDGLQEIPAPPQQSPQPPEMMQIAPAAASAQPAQAFPQAASAQPAQAFPQAASAQPAQTFPQAPAQPAQAFPQAPAPAQPAQAPAAGGFQPMPGAAYPQQVPPQ